MVQDRSKSAAAQGSKSRAPGKGKKRKVPWGRRIISTLILIVVLAGVVFGLVKAGGWLHAVLSEQHAKTTEAATVEPVTIEECSGTSLALSVAPSATTVAEGSGMDVAVTIENNGQADCTFETSELSVELTGSSGSVWAPTSCSSGWGQTLLLAAGKSWSQTLTWDGSVYQDCAAVQVDGSRATPPAGSYTLKWSGPDSGTSGSAGIQVQ